ncbi:hypothetical protein BUALT_Bualt11G0137300 [Buddleja alternifolia]|uniref:DOG1 domain-containing protein n=1 Tax=Buddleja alternifolia TaxID=168488 RepID=A0AAV6X5J1_9LAMI|nr:hypothetical protein BUALT_Bualt11G0137300 [Buddleja alternifolia]
MSIISRGDCSSSADSFEKFLEGWVARQHTLLDELLKAQETHNNSLQESEIKDLIARTMAHFQEYYQEKSRMIRRNVFDVFSPTWLTSFEKALLWVAGFHPDAAFDLVISSVDDLTSDQSEKIGSLMGKTEIEEKLLEDNLSKIQESVAAPPLAELARREGKRQLVEGEIRRAEAVPIKLRAAMESLVVDADSLRRRVVQELVEILCPLQNVRFLAAAAKAQLRIRASGMEREVEQLNANGP